MGRFFRFFGRLVVIAVGFGVAAGVAAVALVVLNDALVPGQLARLHERGFDLRLAIGVLGFGGLVAHAAFMPFLVLAAIGELARRRDWLAHALGGALVAVAIILTADRTGIALAHDAGHLAIDLVSGMIAATAYWIVAGRGAGRWLPSEAEPTAPVIAPE